MYSLYNRPRVRTRDRGTRVRVRRFQPRQLHRLPRIRHRLRAPLHGVDASHVRCGVTIFRTPAGGILAAHRGNALRSDGDTTITDLERPHAGCEHALDERRVPPRTGIILTRADCG